MTRGRPARRGRTRARVPRGGRLRARHARGASAAAAPRDRRGWFVLLTAGDSETNHPRGRQRMLAHRRPSRATRYGLHARTRAPRRRRARGRSPCARASRAPARARDRSAGTARSRRRSSATAASSSPARVAVGERRGDEPRVDPELEQPALDPLRPPVVERAAVLGERARVARVVDVALAHERLERALDRRLVDVLAREVPAHLGCSSGRACRGSGTRGRARAAAAPRARARTRPGRRDSPPPPAQAIDVTAVRRRRPGYAASTPATGTGTGSSRSIGATRSCPMPSAA